MGKHTPRLSDAREGEVWALTDHRGQERPHVRSTGGWRSFGRRNRLFHESEFEHGRLIWAPRQHKETDHG